MELQLFNFGPEPVRVTDQNGTPWFIAADVCRILEIGNTTQALQRLDADEQALISIEGLSRGNDACNIISESGLYSLVLTSRKPQAKAFKRWITSEVLPAIRRTGSYGHAPLPPATGPAAAFINGIDRLIERGIAPNTAAIQLARVWNRRDAEDAPTLEEDTATFHTLLIQHIDEASAVLRHTISQLATLLHWPATTRRLTRVLRSLSSQFPQAITHLRTTTARLWNIHPQALLSAP